ncbi:MAG: hypothetical protein CM1200mP35_03830 [Chloroflexota bacterium]|nr:MAG: hypothetical protein CM1200mP35_03830 [Chloroflexota bacterium]
MGIIQQEWHNRSIQADLNSLTILVFKAYYGVIDANLVTYQCLDSQLFVNHVLQTIFSPFSLGKRGTLYSYTVLEYLHESGPAEYRIRSEKSNYRRGPHVLAEVIECAYSDIKIGMQMDLAIELVSIPENNRVISVYKWKPSS